jgi:hypothetical protein
MKDNQTRKHLPVAEQPITAKVYSKNTRARKRGTEIQKKGDIGKNKIYFKGGKGDKYPLKKNCRSNRGKETTHN